MVLLRNVDVSPHWIQVESEGRTIQAVLLHPFRKLLGD